MAVEPEQWPYYEALEVRDFVALDLPAPKWIVEELIPGDGWVLIVADPKTGKSILSAQLSDALTEGADFLGFKIPEAKRVAYVQTDAPQGVWHAQLRLLCPKARFKTLRTPKGALASPMERLKLKKALVDYDFVVFDALEHFTGHFDLNTEVGAKQIIAAFKEVAGGKPFLLVHHPHKPKPGFIERAVTKSAGHHYLAGDASGTLDLVLSETGQGGTLKYQNRLTESGEVKLARMPKAQGGGWLVKPPKPPVPRLPAPAAGPAPWQPQSGVDLWQQPLPPDRDD